MSNLFSCDRCGAVIDLSEETPVRARERKFEVKVLCKSDFVLKKDVCGKCFTLLREWFNILPGREA